MRRFERSLITEWRRLELPFADKTAVVAVSGGADSVSLLVALDELKKAKKIGLRVVAAHFNHRLRENESDDDETFVRQIAAERNIELAVERSSHPPQSNVEQIARNERYSFLRQTASNLNAFAVLTAHTVDDQAETFLLNLIRGSGAQGLSAMHSIRDLGGADSKVKLIRPLLTWGRRTETEGYCHELGIDYRSDTMNEDESFMRVRVRKVLIPLLRDFNPRIVERLAETGRLLQTQLPDIPESVSETLELDHLKSLPESELKHLLRMWISTNRGDLRQIGLKHIEAIEHLINSRKSGKTIELPGGDAVFKQNGLLCFGKNLVEKRVSDA